MSNAWTDAERSDLLKLTTPEFCRKHRRSEAAVRRMLLRANHRRPEKRSEAYEPASPAAKFGGLEAERADLERRSNHLLGLMRLACLDGRD